MIDKGIQKELTLFYFFVKKYKNIAWASCGFTATRTFCLRQLDLLREGGRVDSCSCYRTVYMIYLLPG
jgi:hypothetical protein